MRVVAILQARMGSTRLPGKVLRDLCGRPMLAQQIRRVGAAATLDALVVATTDRPEDDAVAKLAAACAVAVFRGDALDVLDRYYRAAQAAGAEIIVRLTGDCPLHDPEIIDETVRHFFDGAFDYAVDAPCHPDGTDTEVFSFAALARAWREAELPSEREHVTPYIRNHPELFKSDAGRIDEAAASPLHWSVDDEADFRFAEAVYRELDREDRIFRVGDVMALLARRPDLMQPNRGGTGYDGYRRSLEEDAEFLRRRALPRQAWLAMAQEDAGDRGLTLRRARFEDARRLWDWRNDPVTRAMSRDTRPIAWADHREWCRGRLRDPRCLMLIGECAGDAVGVVRFERTADGAAEIGLTVAPQRRGRGLGRPLLADACRLARDAGFAAAFTAAIKPANIASQRIFLAAGFRQIACDDGLLQYRCEPG